MNIPQYFSDSYPQARQHFVRLCEHHGYELTSIKNEAVQGPDGGELYIDVATCGPQDASKLLVLFSATHGVEGYCGSGIQNALLGESVLGGAQPDLRVVLVHGVNPYGFAHNRRVNEDNIDLNRNFIDFGTEIPADNGYGDIHEWLVPAEWSGPARKAADAGLAAYAQTHGPAAFQQAATGGQYTHPNGLFYGGVQTSWSAQTVLDQVHSLASGVERACFIDFHTGLGPYGHGEMIAAGYPPQVQRTFKFFHGYQVTDPDAGTSSSAPIQGTMAHGLERRLADVETIFIALEYGTLPMKEVMTALRADNWLYNAGEMHTPDGVAIKKQIRDAFFCDEDRWKEMVYERAADVVQAALQRL